MIYPSTKKKTVNQEDSTRDKILRRRMNNRLSAQNARDRKKATMEALISKVQELSKENDGLREMNAALLNLISGGKVNQDDKTLESMGVSAAVISPADSKSVLSEVPVEKSTLTAEAGQIENALLREIFLPRKILGPFVMLMVTLLSHLGLTFDTNPILSSQSSMIRIRPTQQCRDWIKKCASCCLNYFRSRNHPPSTISNRTHTSKLIALRTNQTFCFRPKFLPCPQQKPLKLRKTTSSRRSQSIAISPQTSILSSLINSCFNPIISRRTIPSNLINHPPTRKIACSPKLLAATQSRKNFRSTGKMISCHFSCNKAKPTLCGFLRQIS